MTAEEAHDQIADELFEQKRRGEMKQYLDKLRAQATSSGRTTRSTRSTTRSGASGSGRRLPRRLRAAAADIGPGRLRQPPSN